MKKVADNRKPKGVKIAPQKVELTTVKVPRYMHFGGHKIHTPKQIVLKGYEGYLVFGDVEVKNIQLAKEHLESAKAKDELILLFKTNKTDAGRCMAWTEKIETVISYRNMRLAAAINLEAISKQNGVEHQTSEQFMQSELGSELVGKDLEIAYLSSRNTDLIIKDITRLVSVTHEKTTNVGTIRVSRKNQNGSSTSDKQVRK